MSLEPPIRLAPLDPTSPGAQALIAQSEALMTALYPGESNHFEPAAVRSAARRSASWRSNWPSSFNSENSSLI